VRISTEGLPILIPAQKGERPDGLATFFIRSEEEQRLLSFGIAKQDRQRIRVLRDDEVGPKAAEKLLTAEERERLNVALNLRDGVDTDNKDLRRRGIEQARRLLHQLSESDESDDLFASRMAHTPQFACTQFQSLVTEKLQHIKLVMWFSPQRKIFTPALFTPDRTAAIFMDALLALRTCPYCLGMFAPTRDDSIYCNPVHRERYRARKAYHRRKAKKNRRKHGKRR
jgi:hypothetical protein